MCLYTPHLEGFLIQINVSRSFRRRDTVTLPRCVARPVRSDARLQKDRHSRAFAEAGCAPHRQVQVRREPLPAPIARLRRSGEACHGVDASASTSPRTATGPCRHTGRPSHADTKLTQIMAPGGERGRELLCSLKRPQEWSIGTRGRQHDRYPAATTKYSPSPNLHTAK
jgi:hypothetical protein